MEVGLRFASEAGVFFYFFFLDLGFATVVDLGYVSAVTWEFWIFDSCKMGTGLN